MKNNKLIAEFMGVNVITLDDVRKNKDPYHSSSDGYLKDDLKYHSSWDWLMPVVEKIENLGYEFTIIESRCNINHNTDHSEEELFHIETLGSKLDTTYQAVVKFIKHLKNYMSTENNKLIAEFMGVEEAYNPNGNDWVLKTTTPDAYGDTDILESYKDNELQYHSSWDWLMPVVEVCLIGEAEQSEEISNTTIKNIYEGICNQDISFAYKSVVEFVNYKTI